MGKVQDLFAYQKGFKLSMAIFHRTKKFPKEEKYSMTDQIRRSSRSVVTNLAEAYRRRRSQKYFEAKLNDCETERLRNAGLAGLRARLRIPPAARVR
ncbi:MAG TPA: four helix bundle protein [Flavobacteriales bacterium]|nr:four helix bundle protein [Flavobacteriales bacterium]